MRDKFIDITVIFLVPLAYSIIANGNYAEALGFSVFGGLLGMLFYQAIYKWYISKRLSITQTTLRRYAIGTVLFALIGIPSFVSQVNERREYGKLEGLIGSLLGKAHGACEMASYIRGRYCANFVLTKEMDASCKSNLADVTPSSVKAEFEGVIVKSQYRAMVQDLKQKVDDGFAVIDKNGVKIEDACSKYQEFVTTTFKSAVDEISVRKSGLR